jgi:photosystem II stability/assembly factor-like uncharacterized protein
MAQEFDFVLTNSTATESQVGILSPIELNSQKSTKFRAVTPYATSYPANSTFIFRTNDTVYTYQPQIITTPQDIVNQFNNQFDIGDVSLFANNAIDGTVYEIVSPYSFIELEINLSIVQWVEQLNTSYYGIYNISFKNSLEGIATSLGGCYFTNDGGATWNVITDGSGSLNLAVKVLSSGVGYSSGLSGNIHKTPNINGGTWISQVSGSIENLNSINFIDDNTGWVCGNTGEIRATVNGGTNWNPQVSGTSNTLLSIFFIDSNNGWACGTFGTILYTTDGGANWNAGTSGTIIDLYSIFFIDSNNGWACGLSGTLLVSTDGGVNWTPQVSGTVNDLYAMFFTDLNNGWSCGENQEVLHTINGGTTWTSETLGAGTEILNGLYFTSQNNGWVCGSISGLIDLIYKYS